MKKKTQIAIIAAVSALVIASFSSAAERFERHTGTAAINITAVAGGSSLPMWNAAGVEIRLHLSPAATGGTITVDIDSSAGVEYDCIIESYDMSGVSDYARVFDNRIKAGDALRIQWANPGGVAWGMEIIWR